MYGMIPSANTLNFWSAPPVKGVREQAQDPLCLRLKESRNTVGVHARYGNRDAQTING